MKRIGGIGIAGLAATVHAAAILSIMPAGSSIAQDLPPVAIYQSMLQASKKPGWVQFRNFGGAQWIYFTALQTLHCRLSEIRYSVNSEALDEIFELVKCNPQNPFALPSDAGPEAIAIRLAPGTAKSVAVQVVWDDESESPVLVYGLCKDVGERSCAQPLDR